MTSGCRASGLGFRALGLGRRALGLGFRALGLGHRALGLGFRVLEFVGHFGFQGAGHGVGLEIIRIWSRRRA